MKKRESTRSILSLPVGAPGVRAAQRRGLRQRGGWGGEVHPAQEGSRKTRARVPRGRRVRQTRVHATAASGEASSVVSLPSSAPRCNGPAIEDPKNSCGPGRLQVRSTWSVVLNTTLHCFCGAGLVPLPCPLQRGFTTVRHVQQSCSRKALRWHSRRDCPLGSAPSGTSEE